MKYRSLILISSFFLLTTQTLAVMTSQPIQKPERVAAGCVKTGCSGQICSDKDVISTCEYTEAYACYKTATCERQANGVCGWTQTKELLACLNGSSTPPPVAVTIVPRPTGKTGPTPTCSPRPACLDEIPACQLFYYPPGGYCDTTPAPKPTCMPRPACLDTEPRCMLAEPEGGFCPTTTPTPTMLPYPKPPEWIQLLPPPARNLMELLFLWKNFYKRK